MDKINTELKFAQVIATPAVAEPYDTVDDDDEYPERLEYRAQYEPLSKEDFIKVELPFVYPVITINDKVFDSSDFSLDIFAILNKSMDSRTWYDIRNNKNYSEFSNFYLITCGCGEPGCAGIFDGIRVKVRGRTVEWRIRDEKTVEWLGKSFFSFDKQEYINALQGIRQKIEALESEVGKPIVLDVSVFQDECYYLKDLIR